MSEKKYNALLLGRDGKIIKPLNAPLANAKFLNPEIRHMEDFDVTDTRESVAFETAFLVDHRFFDPQLIGNDMGMYVVADNRQEAVSTYRAFLQSRDSKKEFAEVKKSHIFDSLVAAAAKNQPASREPR